MSKKGTAPFAHYLAKRQDSFRTSQEKGDKTVQDNKLSNYFDEQFDNIYKQQSGDDPRSNVPDNTDTCKIHEQDDDKFIKSQERLFDKKSISSAS